MTKVKKDIISRLSRVFSSDVVIRNIGGNTLKVVDINKQSQAGSIETNGLDARYNRLYSGNLYGYGDPASNYPFLRTQVYSDYEAMDMDPIITSVLDIIADESTLKNSMGEVLTIRSSDDDIQKILYNLFYDVLNIEFNLWTWIRSMCKYGDFFLKLQIAEKYGVYNVIPYSAYTVNRIEGYDQNNPQAVKFEYMPEGITGGSGYYPHGSFPERDNKGVNYFFDNFEMAHFRLLSDMNFFPYGKSYIEGARNAWRRLTMMEDAMLIHRIVRAPEKRVFYINVAGINPNEIDAYMQKVINKMKKTPYIGPDGQYNLRYNMQNMLEDFYIPIRGNDPSTKIDTTKGLDYDGIQDVEYLRDRMFAALKVPKAFIGYDAQLQGKATLAAEDIRFARTIERIQRIVVSELYKIAVVHLYVQGYNNEDLVNFELGLTTPSIIYDQEQIALLKEKVALAKDIQDAKLFPESWIYDHIFHCSEDEYEEYRDLILEDTKRKFRLTQIEEEGNDPIITGKSYGTPHSLASLYGQGRYGINSVPNPEEYAKDAKVGRPKTKNSIINTQEDPLGKDRLGKEENHELNDKEKPNKASKSPLRLESHGYILESLKSKEKNFKNLGNHPLLNKVLTI